MQNTSESACVAGGCRSRNREQRLFLALGQGRLLAKAFTQGVVRMEVKIGSKKIKRNGSFGCPGN